MKISDKNPASIPLRERWIGVCWIGGWVKVGWGGLGSSADALQMALMPSPKSWFYF